MLCPPDGSINQTNVDDPPHRQNAIRRISSLRRHGPRPRLFTVRVLRLPFPTFAEFSFVPNH